MHHNNVTYSKHAYKLRIPKNRKMALTLTVRKCITCQNPDPDSEDYRKLFLWQQEKLQRHLKLGSKDTEVKV